MSIIHPVFPFGVFYGIIPWILTWDGDENDATPFFYDKKENSYADKLQFSHDGKYLSWIIKSSEYGVNVRPQFWIAKVDKNIPGYIGKPQLLGSTYSDEAEPLATAWAENPNTFIVSERNGLYWWHVE